MLLRLVQRQRSAGASSAPLSSQNIFSAHPRHSGERGFASTTSHSRTTTQVQRPLRSRIFHSPHLLTSARPEPLRTIQQPRRNFAGIFSQMRGGAKLDPRPEEQDEFDLIVIGGGSGGLALSREAARLGKRVAVLDYVAASAQGSRWEGLGGTCVNVGCIPKKFFHRAGLFQEELQDAHAYGWRPSSDTAAATGKETASLKELSQHDWSALRTRVAERISSLNFGYRQRLLDDNIANFNALGSFVDENTVLAKFEDGTERKLTAKKFALAVGNRPKDLGIEGQELAISSDDVFSLEKPPGKTLSIGGSYVALETAGFLQALGMESTVMARSILLRGMDQELADFLGEDLQNRGVKILRRTVPEKLTKLDNGQIRVQFRNTETDEVAEEDFDTVFNAIGRVPVTGPLNLDAIGVQLSSNGKVKADERTEQTSLEHVYALGDVADGRPELTPVAIQAGRLLARRLYLDTEAEKGEQGASAEGVSSSTSAPPPNSVTKKSDPTGYWRSHAGHANDRLYVRYDLVPSTVFTPMEYSMCGLSEEAAIKLFGTKAVRIYHSHFQPLEWTIPERGENSGFIKIVCDANRDYLVVGLHYLGPNAAEVMQGYAVAMQMGMTYRDLQDTIAIHPSTSEEVLLTDIAKDSGLSPIRVGCCG